MECYLDFIIQGIPTDEHLLRSRLFTVLHGVLSRHYDGTVGLSFPEIIENKLGKVIRAFGTQEVLQHLNHQPALQNLADRGAIQINYILRTPDETGAVRFIRDRSVEKQGRYYLARCQKRRQKRGTDKSEFAKPLSVANQRFNNCLPYVQLLSSSNENNFSISIRKQDAVFTQEGTFSSYGLSKKGSTVPWF